MFVEHTVNVTIQPDCLNTSFVDRQLDDMSIIVTGSASQSIFFADTTSNFHSNPSFCGPRVYTFDVGTPAYLLVDASAATLTLATNNVNDRGNHNVSFTVTLQNYASVSGLDKTFGVTITCVV